MQKNPRQCVGFEQTLSDHPTQRHLNMPQFQACFSALQTDPKRASKRVVEDGVQQGVQQLTILADHLQEVEPHPDKNRARGGVMVYVNTWNDETTATFLELREFVLPFLARLRYTDQWCQLGVPGDKDWSWMGASYDKKATWRTESGVKNGIDMLCAAVSAGCFSSSEKETRILAKIVLLDGIYGLDLTWEVLDTIIFSGKRHAIDGLAKEIEWLKKNDWSGQSLLADLSLRCLIHGCTMGGRGQCLGVATWTTKDDVRAACELVRDIFDQFRHNLDCYESLMEDLRILVRIRPDLAQTAWDTLGLSLRTHLVTKALFVCECDWKEEEVLAKEEQQRWSSVDLLRAVSISIALWDETQQHQQTTTTASTADEGIFAYLTEDKRVQNVLQMKRCTISRSEASWHYFLSEFKRMPTNIPVCVCCSNGKAKPLLYCNWKKGMAERKEIQQIKKSAEEAAAQDQHAESLVLCQTALDLIASQKDPVMESNYPTLSDTIQLLAGKALFQLGRYRESIKALDNSLPPNYGWGGGLKGNSNGFGLSGVANAAKWRGISEEAYKQQERTKLIDCGAHEACVHSLLMRAKFNAGFTKDVRDDAEMLLRAKLEDGEDPIGVEDIAQAQKHAREILVELDASTLRMHRSGKCCAYCKKAPEANEKFNACSNCRMYRYCCRQCQKNHWKNGHKEECLKEKESTK